MLLVVPINAYDEDDMLLNEPFEMSCKWLDTERMRPHEVWDLRARETMVRLLREQAGLLEMAHVFGRAAESLLRYDAERSECAT